MLSGHRWAVAARRQVGRASEVKGAVIAAGVLFVLLMIWWSPGHTFDHLVTALVFVLLAIGAVVALVSVSSRERAALPGGG